MEFLCESLVLLMHGFATIGAVSFFLFFLLSEALVYFSGVYTG